MPGTIASTDWPTITGPFIVRHFTTTTTHPSPLHHRRLLHRLFSSSSTGLRQTPRHFSADRSDIVRPPAKQAGFNRLPPPPAPTPGRRRRRRFAHLITSSSSGHFTSSSPCHRHFTTTSLSSLHRVFIGHWPFIIDNNNNNHHRTPPGSSPPARPPSPYRHSLKHQPSVVVAQTRPASGQLCPPPCHHHWVLHHTHFTDWTPTLRATADTPPAYAVAPLARCPSPPRRTRTTYTHHPHRRRTHLHTPHTTTYRRHIVARPARA